MNAHSDPKSHIATLSITGFKSAQNILASWGCNSEQTKKILGLTDNAFRKLKSASDSTNLDKIQLERISHILNIHSTLRSVFSNPKNVKNFMKMNNHNDFFKGLAPIEIIESGDFIKLHETSIHINSLREN